MLCKCKTLEERIKKLEESSRYELTSKAKACEQLIWQLRDWSIAGGVLPVETITQIVKQINELQLAKN